MAAKGKRAGKSAAAKKISADTALKRQDLQRAILAAAAQAGAEFGAEGLTAYLRAQALAAPGSFLTLLGKTLAKEEEREMPAIRLIELVPAEAEPAEAEAAEAEPAEAAPAETEPAEAEPGEREPKRAERK